METHPCARLVQARPPMKTLLPWRAIVSCTPSPIVIGGWAEVTLESTVCSTPFPLTGSVPAINRVELLSSPTRAATKATEFPGARDELPTEVTAVTAAAVPPHSRPQLNTKAVASSALNTAETG